MQIGIFKSVQLMPVLCRFWNKTHTTSKLPRHSIELLL